MSIFRLKAFGFGKTIVLFGQSFFCFMGSFRVICNSCNSRSSNSVNLCEIVIKIQENYSDIEKEKKSPHCIHGHA